MKKATYRIIEFVMDAGPSRFIGLAWNYDEAALLSTRDYGTYREAREALEGLALSRDVRLQYYDGHYVRYSGDDLMYLVGEGT